jgi:hypothetical protein
MVRNCSVQRRNCLEGPSNPANILSETIQLLNSLIAGVSFSIPWLYFSGMNIVVILFIISAMGTWFIQSLCINISYMREEEKEERLRIVITEEEKEERSSL